MLERNRLVVEYLMIATRRNDHAVLEQGLRADALHRRWISDRADDQIDVAAGKFRKKLFVNAIDDNHIGIGKFIQEPGDSRRHQIHTRQRQDTDRHSTLGMTANNGDLLHRLANLEKRQLGPTDQDFTAIGADHALRRPVEQARVQALLYVPERPVCRRLRNAKPGGRRRDALHVTDRDDGVQLVISDKTSQLYDAFRIAGRAYLSPHFGLGLRQMVEGARGPIDENDAQFCRDHALACTLEQYDAHFLLERLNRARNGGLGNVEANRRLGDPAGPGDRQ